MSARVIAFPLARRVGRVRHTADVLSRWSGSDADRYWRLVTDQMRTQLSAAGIEHGVIESEISAFADSVSAATAQPPKGGVPGRRA